VTQAESTVGYEIRILIPRNICMGLSIIFRYFMAVRNRWQKINFTCLKMH